MKNQSQYIFPVKSPNKIPTPEVKPESTSELTPNPSVFDTAKPTKAQAE